MMPLLNCAAIKSRFDIQAMKHRHLTVKTNLQLRLQYDFVSPRYILKAELQDPDYLNGTLTKHHLKTE